MQRGTETCFPEKKKIRKTDSLSIVWYTEELKQMSQTLNFLYDLFKLRNTPNIINTFKQERKKFRQELAAAKKRANNTFITNVSNPQNAIWSLVNNSKSKQKKLDTNLTLDDFNNFFWKCCSKCKE
ncbi:unnamed protein product [Psylliodes chrysocephalus]|uniref:Uncharacterized protein n=1 Tax=Psylliodes chrysocephalus TaxID=3402493 RepID=A0A9P0GAU9_9CUCU|nr:unnamed protein product [Psylliodes chrysocephala]